jgi:hypothetical protein
MKHELERLFEHEIDDVVPADHEQRIRAGLDALLSRASVASQIVSNAKAPAAPPADTLSTASATAAQGAAVKLTTAVLLGLGLAAGGFAAGRVTAPAATASLSSSADVPPTTTPGVAASPSPVSSPSSPSSSSSFAGPDSPRASSEDSAARPSRPPAGAIVAAAATTSSASAFDREQSLLERARSALVRHDAVAAGEALDASEREFPRSRHAEERDYLYIQLLRERGDTAQARERARTFLTKYPGSLLRSRVEPLAQ